MYNISQINLDTQIALQYLDGLGIRVYERDVLPAGGLNSFKNYDTITQYEQNSTS